MDNRVRCIVHLALILAAIVLAWGEPLPLHAQYIACTQTCTGPALAPTATPTPVGQSICVPVPNCPVGPCPCVRVTVTPTETPVGTRPTPTATATATSTVIPGSSADVAGDWFTPPIEYGGCGDGFVCHADWSVISDVDKCVLSRLGTLKRGTCISASPVLGIVDSRLVPDLPAEIGVGRTCTLICGVLGRDRPGYWWDFDRTNPAVCSYAGPLAGAKTCARAEDVGKTQTGRIILASPYEHGVWRKRIVYQNKMCVKSGTSCVLRALPQSSTCSYGSKPALVTGCRKAAAGAAGFSCVATSRQFVCGS